jgi:hypothetical protein
MQSSNREGVMSKNKTLYPVTLPEGKRPGLMRCGDLVPGTTYEFPAAEAVRMVDAHGFEFTIKTDEKSARAEVSAGVSEAVDTELPPLPSAPARLPFGDGDAATTTHEEA